MSLEKLERLKFLIQKCDEIYEELVNREGCGGRDLIPLYEMLANFTEERNTLIDDLIIFSSINDF